MGLAEDNTDWLDLEESCRARNWEAHGVTRHGTCNSQTFLILDYL